MREFTVNKNDAGQRLDRFTAKAVPLLPSSLAQKYIRLGRIKVDGRPAKRDTRLAAGSAVQMYVNDEFFSPGAASRGEDFSSAPAPDIVYEDENILLADKSPGVLCHSDGDWSHAALIARIQAYLRRRGEWDPRAENSFAPALCNRIDRNTGGIVIAAKNAEALRVINEKIKNRELDKYYLCAVHGRPEPPSGRLSGYIFKDAGKNRVYVRERREPGARSAETEYRVLETRGGLSLLECRLVTGRTHQIRAQLAAAGWPLLGDGKYGRAALDRPYGEKRQALYSYRLSFSFRSPAGALDYLDGREFSVKKVWFREKYFFVGDRH